MCDPWDAHTKLTLLRCSGHMQTGGVRVFYGISTVSLRCFGEGVARTCMVTVGLPYAACTGPYGACASHTCLRTPVEFYDHCMWPVRVPMMTVSANTGLRAFYGEIKDVHAQLSDTGCLRVYGVYTG